MIHFDSSFLVDLLREHGRQETGPARYFLERLPGERRGCVSVHAVCELHVGVALSSRPDTELRAVSLLLSTLYVVLPEDSFPSTYARLLAVLRQRGTPIATMDLLIGTAAVCAEAPLVTANPQHFRRIPGLEVLTYREVPASAAPPEHTR